MRDHVGWRPPCALILLHGLTLMLAHVEWLAIVLSLVSGIDNPPDTQNSRAGHIEESNVQEFTGITLPKRSVVLSPLHLGRLRTIHVEEGAFVSAGTAVFSLDQSIQSAKTDMARKQAESTLDVELKHARWELAQQHYQRLSNLDYASSATRKELDDALAELEIARLEYELARFHHAQDQLALEYEETILDQATVVAPFEGYVARRISAPGAMVDESQGVVEFVQLNPLMVAVDCPVQMAPLITKGQPLWIEPVDAHWQAKTGTVAFAPRVVDAASQTFKLKIEVENAAADWMPGLKVRVRLDPTIRPDDLNYEPTGNGS